MIRVGTVAAVLLLALSAACSAPATDTPKAPASLTEVASASLARIDGELKVPGLKAPVEIIRDQQGIPHIYAQNERDLRVVQGYIAASDRYFSIEAGRRLGWGELSSLVGDVALSGDQQSRGQGLAVVAQRILDQLTPEQLDTFDAYAEGVNAYIDAVAAQTAEPPTELTLLRLVIPRSEPVMRHVTGRDLIGWLAAASW